MLSDKRDIIRLHKRSVEREHGTNPCFGENGPLEFNAVGRIATGGQSSDFVLSLSPGLDLSDEANFLVESHARGQADKFVSWTKPLRGGWGKVFCFRVSG